MNRGWEVEVEVEVEEEVARRVEVEGGEGEGKWELECCLKGCNSAGFKSIQPWQHQFARWVTTSFAID